MIQLLGASICAGFRRLFLRVCARREESRQRETHRDR
jgi:hypothetical protein